MRKLRRNKGLTQRQLARRLNTTQPRVSQWEHGRIDSITLGKVKKLAKIFGLCELEVVSILLDHNCKKVCDLWKEEK